MTPLNGDSDAAVHPEAHALTLFRVLRNGEGRRYTATTFPKNPWAGCERFIRTCRLLGWLKPATEDADGYAVLDVLDESAAIVQDFIVTTPAAFQQIKRRLHLAVETEEAPDA